MMVDYPDEDEGPSDESLDAREHAVIADLYEQLGEIATSGPCDQCCAISINGVRSHELGCPVEKTRRSIVQSITRLEEA